MCACVCQAASVVSDSATPCTIAHQAPLSMGFSGQEHLSGLTFPSPEDLPDPGFEPRSPALQTLYHLRYQAFTFGIFQNPLQILLTNHLTK